jgi:hypothetical protein
MRQLLPALREVGFRLWDPLGLCEAWQEGEEMADAYDSYLMRAYAAAVNGHGPETICAVLRQAEAAMGLPDASTTDRHMTVTQGIFDLLGDHLPEKMRPYFRSDHTKRNKS